MPRAETPKYKALYFDIRIQDLKKHYSPTNPKGAYSKIKFYFLQHNFSHVQYSGYHSKYKTTDLEIFDLIHEMSGQFPWLRFCINHFEVTNVGANHDLMDLFSPEFDELPEP